MLWRVFPTKPQLHVFPMRFPLLAFDLWPVVLTQGTWLRQAALLSMVFFCFGKTVSMLFRTILPTWSLNR